MTVTDRPLGIPSLISRYRAADLALATGDSVAAWAPSTGTGDLTASGSAQPTFRAAGSSTVGGGAALRFDGVDDVMIATRGTAHGTNTTYVLICKPTRFTTVEQYVEAANVQIMNWTTGVIRAYSGANLDATTATPTTTPVCVVFTATNTTTDTLHVNGTLFASGTSGNPVSTTGLRLGGHSTAGRYLSADVAEVLIFSSALTAAERAAVNSYAQDAYGITVSDYTAPPSPPAGTVSAAASGSGALSATTSEPPFARLADWLWKPIKASPSIDPDSAAMIAAIWPGTGTAAMTASLYDYAVPIIDAAQITDSSTPPRHDVPLAHETGGTDPDTWGPNPFGPGAYLPVSEATNLPPMHATYDGPGENWGDAHYTVIDPIDGKIKSIWQLERTAPSTYRASWGGVGDIDGDGRDTAGSSTGSGFVRPAGVVRIAELAAAAAANTGLNHALFIAVSSSIVGSDFRYPAIKTDGTVTPGSGTLPEGARLQLDPSINVDAIPGITAAEKVIAKTLQTHGCYIGDRTGAVPNMIFEFDQTATPSGTSGVPTSNPGSTYVSLGFTADYFQMTKIPWRTGMRVLATAEVDGIHQTTSGDLSGSGALAATTAPGQILTGALGGVGTLAAAVTPGQTCEALLSGLGGLGATRQATRFTFSPPSQELPFRMEGGLIAATPWGLSAWRANGAWSEGFSPSAETVAAADRFYGGGRIHSLSAAERDELIAAGYGDLITTITEEIT